MSSVRSFQDLTAAMNAPRAPAPERRTTPNPRVAAGLSPAAWDKIKRRERRKAWEARAQSYVGTVNGPPVRDVKRFVSFEDVMIERLRAESCLDRSVPLTLSTHYQHPEKGVSVGQYYAAKMKRFGSLGEHEALNPFWEAIRDGAP